MRVCKAYESNAGTMAIFAIEGDAAVWSHFYFGDAYEMGLVWIELAVNDRDPVAEGWDDAALDIDEWEAGRQIADSCWDHLPYGIDVEDCGTAGREFACAAGAASWCPECRDIIPAVRDVNYPDRWVPLQACPACGAETSDELS